MALRGVERCNVQNFNNQCVIICTRHFAHQEPSTWSHDPAFSSNRCWLRCNHYAFFTRNLLYRKKRISTRYLLNSKREHNDFQSTIKTGYLSFGSAKTYHTQSFNLHTTHNRKRPYHDIGTWYGRFAIYSLQQYPLFISSIVLTVTYCL